MEATKCKRVKEKVKDRNSVEDKVRRMAFHCPAEISGNRRMRRWPDEALTMHTV